MPRRTILTGRQRSALLSLPRTEAELLQYYVLSEEDLQHVRRRRRPHNKLGFALQLCALRYPGRVLTPDELIPKNVMDFIGEQLGLDGDDLLDHAVREETRHEHLAELRDLYGFRTFSGHKARDLRSWLHEEAELARSNEDLARRLVKKCQQARTVLPAITTLERLCSDALVEAERRIEARIAGRIAPELRRGLLALLEDTVDGRLTRFVWLRQFSPGNNSAAANRLLDRLEYLNRLECPDDLFAGVPAHRIARLRRQGERYYADGLRDLSENRRLAILAVCAAEWRSILADTVVETHDRITGKTYRAAMRQCEARIANEATAARETLTSFAGLGNALIKAHDTGEGLDVVIAGKTGWEGLKDLVTAALQLSGTMEADPLDHVAQGYNRFRRYTPRMLRVLDIQAAPVTQPLLRAVQLLRDGERETLPADFLKRNSKWRRHLNTRHANDHRFWETAVLFHLRDSFRSGDLWLKHSRRYGEIKQVLVPAHAIAETTRLAVPERAADWLRDRNAEMTEWLHLLAAATRTGTIPGGSIEDGALHVEKLDAAVPEGAEDLVLDLYRRIPDTRITDTLQDVSTATGFVEAFTHLRTGAPCKDHIGLLNVLLADGINLGLRKMSEATNTHGFWELMRIARWHVEGEAYDRALSMVVEAQAELSAAAFWGLGLTASGDGQFFPTSGMGEAMNLVNAKYGNEPGIKAYTHVSDQFAPFAVQKIPATVHEAPYILDGLLKNEVGRRVREQYADMGGFADHVFAACAILGYALVSRIRDLPSKRLYVLDRAGVPGQLRPLIGGKVNTGLIERNWPDILRLAATMTAGTVAPSLILRKLASFPRQNELATALREVGRVERSIFMVNWIMDPDLRRRAQVGLNKGEAHHALERAIHLHRQGELRDRTGEGQHYRMAGLNLLAAILIYWNTMKLGEAVSKRQRAGLPTPVELLAHVSPLGWEHINLTGEYRWRRRVHGA